MTRSTSMRWAGLLWIGLLLLWAPAASAGPPLRAQPGQPKVLRATIDDSITPVIAQYVDDAIERAESRGYEALLIEIDTPGGLDSSMRDIVQDILDARVPVIVHVAPSGSRAASAGAIITLAAHVAAMAPGTTIGAATPVGGGGEDLDRKVVNDAAAYAQSLAELRGRDVGFAVDAVREGRSITADEAARIGAVDLIAPSVDELLAQVDGRTVELGAERSAHVLRTAGTTVDDYDLGPLRSIRQFLANPTLAFLLISIGTLALIYELATAGIGAGAVVAAVSFVLALAGLSVLPVNVAGLVFLGLAAAFFVAEVAAPGIGVAAVSGAVMLVLSGVFLVDDAPGLELDLAAVLPVAIVTGLLVVVAGRIAARARRAPSTTTGVGLFLDREVTVRVRDDGRSITFVEGTWWNVRPVASSPPLADGDVARVRAMEGLDLVVERLPDQPGRDEASEDKEHQ
ncbi:MAG TPA: nodulation protein NfeD [Acidimicrobiales bacterium]